ncbi:MAG: nicotinamide riboside transporter PnuC [Gammaproteobacteria bacterium]|nr:nicotinamide riboside transporter PnuC [Gammaproteobacteria bacterium]
MILLDRLVAAAETMFVAEVVAVLLAITYLLLVIRQNILCWAAALASVLIYLVIFFNAQLYMESALQIFYAAMAVYGWYQWKYGGIEHQGLRIVTWRLHIHAIVIGGILGLTLGFGWVLSATDAAFPYLDSFTTVAAVITTYMVTRKVLENWAYWFVIDGLSVYLYVSRELYLTAGLFVLYLFMILIGFRCWWREWRTETLATA